MDGIAYLRVRPLLLMTFVVDIIAMVCGMPRALFPQMAQETFGGPAGGGLALGMLNAGHGARVAAGRADRRLDPPGVPAGHRDRAGDPAVGGVGQPVRR